MNLDEIKVKWTKKYKNKKAVIDMWDTMAVQFKDYDNLRKENLLLKIIEREEMIQPNSRVLDVGCGTGTYSIALSDKTLAVTGIDISPKMIAFGQENLDQLNVTNVNLICSDWSQFDILKNGFADSFDLVFAHMTPAISDAETFEKMLRCSKNYGIIFKPTRRADEVLDEILKMSGIDKNTLGRDESIMYAFDMLWLMGYKPKLEYEEQEWNIKKSFEETCSMYMNRVKSYKDISNNMEENIKQFLRSKLKDGFIKEKVNTTISVLYWGKR